MITEQKKSYWPWVPAGLVIAWNGLSCYRAYTEFQKLPPRTASDYTDQLRAYLRKYYNLFLRISLVTPPKWDDILIGASGVILVSDRMWSYVAWLLRFEIRRDNQIEVPPHSDPEPAKKKFRERIQDIRNRKKNPQPGLAVNPEEVYTGVALTSDEEAGSLASFALILSILASCGNVFSFLKRMNDIGDVVTEALTQTTLRR